jgi:hypothetical protein
VLGHTKTVLVLLASWWVFQEPMIPRKLLGMALAVVGMAAYGHAAMRRSSIKKQPSKLKDGSDVDGFAQVLVPEAVGVAKGRAAPTAHPIRLSDAGASSSDGTGSGDGTTFVLQKRPRARQLA